MKQTKVPITLPDDSVVEAMAPILVSASRSTDIPAFYSDWFFKRLEEGYSAWTNPFNGVKSYISYCNTRFIVFWSKNPKPLLKHIEKLKNKNINFYVQFSLNDYEQEGYEPNVPILQSRIDTFKQLVDATDNNHVIWRFDPLILTSKLRVDDLISRIEFIGDQLKGYTKKLVFSFVDIDIYAKVKRNLDNNGIPYVNWTQELQYEFAEKLSALNSKWKYKLATCGEKSDLNQFGVEHNHCVDDSLIARIAYSDKVLMDYLGMKIEEKQPSLFGNLDLPSNAIDLGNNKFAVPSKNNLDKGQRQFCGCIMSKDIGQYNTCIHKCVYCYANTTPERAYANYEQHKKNPNSATITGL